MKKSKPNKPFKLRTSIMVMRLTESERRELERNAHKLGLPVSSWARMRLLESVRQREPEPVS